MAKPSPRSTGTSFFERRPPESRPLRGGSKRSAAKRQAARPAAMICELAVLACVFAGAPALQAGQVQACVDFTGSGIAQAEQAQIVMKAQGYYADAGLGPTDAD